MKKKKQITHKLRFTCGEALEGEMSDEGDVLLLFHYHITPSGYYEPCNDYVILRKSLPKLIRFLQKFVLPKRKP